mgnify:CR=1 FL=1
MKIGVIQASSQIEKNTILYKNVYDNIDNLNFEKETIDNFKNLFDNIIKNMEE